MGRFLSEWVLFSGIHQQPLAAVWTGVGRWLVNVRSKAHVGGACAVFTVLGPAPSRSSSLVQEM